MPLRLVCWDGPLAAPALAAARDALGVLRAAPLQPLAALHAAVTHEDPLVPALLLCVLASLGCWLAYLATNNCSHVDRLWSIVAPVYVAIFGRDALADAAELALGRPLPRAWRSRGAASDAPPVLHTRLLVAVALTATWGCRLTANFARKGGYSLSYEDHRWREARTLMPPALYELFSLVFVAAAQHALCLLMTAPAYVAALAPPQAMGVAGWAAAAAFAALLAGETLADQQQWDFQTRKAALIKSGGARRGDYKRGFRTTGLFALSRHPAFFCEYGMWWCLYVLCAVLPTGCVVGWAAAGAVGLTLLFHGGSRWVTERISVRRYPQYRAYQATTSAIVPWWAGPPLPEPAD